MNDEHQPELGTTASHDATGSPSGARRSARLRWLTIGLAVIVGLSAIYVTSGLLVRHRVLDPATYRGALVEARAYDRIYTEVLPDPELVGVAHDLLGNLGVDERVGQQATALTTSSLRWAVPPDRIREGTEFVIDRIVDYVRGDTPRLTVALELSPLLDHVGDGIVVRGRNLLASKVDRAFGSLSAYEDAASEFAAELAAGRIPDWVPVVGGDEFEPTEVVDAILEATGRSDDALLREQVLASVLIDDERAALLAAATGALEQYGDSVAQRLTVVEDVSPDGTAGAELDVVQAIAERARTTGDAVIGSFDAARDIAALLGPVPVSIAAVIGIAGLIGLVVVRRQQLRLVGKIVAVTFGSASLVTLVVWFFVGRAIAAPLRAAVGSEPGSWRLPPGVVGVLTDVFASIGNQFRDSVLRAVVVLAAVSLGAAVLVAVDSPRVKLPVPRRRALAIGGAVVLAGAGICVATVGTGSVVASQRACNGAIELCDRPYDEVAYAATHNSMSTPDVVQVWPEHDGFLRSQLDAGIRGLLLDTHYWPAVQTLADLTDIANPESLPIPTAVAQAVIDGLGSRVSGQEGTFLCHNHCAFGGIDLATGLGDVRAFLDDNPDEVVTLIIQDAITPEDTEAAMAAAGLTDTLYPHDHGGSWPTLGEMIERGTRLVVFAEEAGPPPDWYANAWESMQDTPFLVLERDRFTCDHDRGDPDASLFLMNHWIQRVAPDRSDAVVVNDYDFLLARARQCEAERGQMPNFIAVDFYSIGDVVGVVDTLNGVGLGPPSSDVGVPPSVN